MRYSRRFAAAAAGAPAYLRFAAVARLRRLRARFFFIRLFFMRRPRNYCLGVGTSGQVLQHTTLGRHLAYMFWRYRPSLV